MIVRMIMGVNPAVAGRFAVVSNVFEHLLNYFQDKFYGKSVTEIAGVIVCHDSYQLQFIGLGQEYSSRKKSISFLFKFDYEDAKQMNRDEILAKSIDLLFEACAEFALLRIKDFDLNLFIEELKQYFIKIGDFNGKDPDKQFPQLNAETVRIMENKWKKFLKD